MYVNFFAEIFSTVNKAIGSGESDLEGDVILTIEPTVQSYFEKVLEDTKTKYSGSIVAGVVMNPKNGEILAMASNPSFNPNSFGKEDSLSVFVNPIVERVYEMGSIVKPLTMAAGIDSGSVTPKTTYYDKGYIVLNGARIENFDGKGRGEVDMQAVLNNSLNTGVSFVVGKMGNKNFADYMFNYGLAEKSGIDLPNEVKGLLSNLHSPRDIEYATASFGQGIAISPIAITRALASLGNGGLLPTPHIVKRIDYKLGFSVTPDIPTPKQILKPETSKQITDMLVQVVDKALLGGTKKLDHYSVAAKTGTAQIAKEGSRGYYEDRFLHSFFGYFPASDPKFIVFLLISNPHGVRYASETLTEPFFETTNFLLNYYNVPPDR